MSLQVEVGLGLAAACAMATNLASLYKHRGAQSAPAVELRRPLASAHNLLGSRWFAVGMAVAMGAGVLHIAALALAPISIVQAVLASGVVLLAVMARRLFGHTVPGRQWAGVALSAAGLAVLALTLPTLAVGELAFSRVRMLGFELVLSVLAACLVFGPPQVGRLFAHRGVLLGAAGGTLFGVSDVAVKALTELAHSGILYVMTSPWLLLAIAGGVLAQYASVRGLQQGEAVPVIALTGLTANVANITGGILVFGDPLATSTLGLFSQVLAFALICAAAFVTPTPAANVERQAGLSGARIA